MLSGINLVLAGRLDVFIASPALTEKMIKQVDQERVLVEHPFQPKFKRGTFIALSKKSSWHQHIALFNQLQTSILENKP